MTKIPHPRILLIGTGDTKADELLYMSNCIMEAGGEPIMMDVSVLADPPYKPHHDKHAVAKAAQKTIDQVAASGDENSAMSLMAVGATRLTPSSTASRAGLSPIICSNLRGRGP